MTTIHLTKIRDLTAPQLSAWQEIQQSTPLYESPYFRPEFAQAVAAVRSDVEVAVLRDAEKNVGFFPFQRGKLNLGKPVGGSSLTITARCSAPAVALIRRNF
jgi:CelD/BcsL family acetyltransferase involved in cellulose biosynthesis